MLRVSGASTSTTTTRDIGHQQQRTLLLVAAQEMSKIALYCRFAV